MRIRTSSADWQCAVRPSMDALRHSTIAGRVARFRPENEKPARASTLRAQQPLRDLAAARARQLAQEVDAARCCREVRCGREAERQEGPRAPCDVVWKCLRRPHRPRRGQPPDGQSSRRSRRVERAVARHCIQPLHCPRHRDAEGHAPTEARRRHGLLAALALRPAARRPRSSSRNASCSSSSSSRTVRSLPEASMKTAEATRSTRTGALGLGPPLR